MSKQAESKLSGDILKALRAKGYFAFKVHGGPSMMAGLPDIIVCVEGFFCGLETKMPAKRNNVSEIQKLRHEEIRDAGGFAAVVCGVNEALSLIEDWVKQVKRINTMLETAEEVPTFGAPSKANSGWSLTQAAIESLREHRMGDLPHTRDERVLGRREGENNAFGLVIDLGLGRL
jgi:hypothetical protein